MVSEDELIKACDILSEYCGNGDKCNGCIFETACIKWDSCEIDNMTHFMNECKSNLLINKYRGKLFEALFALDAVCSCFTNCGECIFSHVDVCPKVAVNNTLHRIDEGGL